MNNSIVNIDKVIDVDVENLQGDNLGTVKTIMLDKASGKVAYAVLSYGGFLGMGDKLFALPWKVLEYNPQREKFVIALDQEKLKNSPGFDKDHWPDMSSSQWQSSINNYYNLH